MLTISTILVMTSLWAAPSGAPSAQDALQALPESEHLTISGKDYWRYDKAAYAKLIEISFDRLLFEQAKTLLEKKVGLLEQKAAKIEESEKLCQENANVHKAEYDRLHKKWLEDNEKRHEAELKASSPWPWVMVGIGGATAGAGGLGLIGDYKNPWAWSLVGVGAITVAVGLVDGLF